MNFKRMVCASTLAVGVGVTGLFGVGLGTAGADPGPPCGGPHAGPCQPAPGPHNNGPNDWQNRGIDHARRDHLPFNYNGHEVYPVRAGNGDGWGFWFLGQWIGL